MAGQQPKWVPPKIKAWRAVLPLEQTSEMGHSRRVWHVRLEGNLGIRVLFDRRCRLQFGRSQHPSVIGGHRSALASLGAELPSQRAERSAQVLA